MQLITVTDSIFFGIFVFGGQATVAFPIPKASAPIPMDRNSLEYLGAIVSSCAEETELKSTKKKRLTNVLLSISKLFPNLKTCYKPKNCISPYISL